VGFVKDTFFGGAEKKAGKTIERSGKKSAGIIREATAAAGEDISPFITKEGGPGLQLQQALSGVLGPEAQASAFQDFKESPGVEFLREQGVRGINTESAVTGRGGGDRLRELTRFSQGLALQDLSNQFSRIGEVSGREEAIVGRQQLAATNLGGLRVTGATAEGEALIEGARGAAEGIVGQAEGRRSGIQGIGAVLSGIF